MSGELGKSDTIDFYLLARNTDGTELTSRLPAIPFYVRLEAARGTSRGRVTISRPSKCPQERAYQGGCVEGRDRQAEDEQTLTPDKQSMSESGLTSDQPGQTQGHPSQRLRRTPSADRVLNSPEKIV